MQLDLPLLNFSASTHQCMHDIATSNLHKSSFTSIRSSLGTGPTSTDNCYMHVSDPYEAYRLYGS